MREFTWIVQKDLTRTPKLNVKVIQFGDGYEQRQRTILGRPTFEYAFTVKSSAADADAAFDFLMDHMGIEPFLWTAPQESVARKVVCDDFKNTQYDGITHAVSGTFREVKA